MSQVNIEPKVVDLHVRCHKCQHYIGFFRQYKPNTACEWHATGVFQAAHGRVKSPLDARRKIIEFHELVVHSQNFM